MRTVEDEEALSLRSERMYEGVEDLYAWFPILDNEDLVERCRALLRQGLPHVSLRRHGYAERRVDWCVSARSGKQFG